ncbi:hypothetical protein SH591_14110 [Sphingomonas sp. LY54]|uniref:hypothetical protein n=1 Tax=Sphingomonas sp. LY54 TaxID=3095343 RepID=UPI002D77D20B|nr:hypothetical protein [Sphingomonas sp. LY54]WRP28222.1 hypothetical protein SH591_14110 [Sphingomonas sp. LY54]
MTLRAIATLVVAAIGAAAPPQALELAKPIDCALGSDCFVQQYYDRAPRASSQGLPLQIAFL